MTLGVTISEQSQMLGLSMLQKNLIKKWLYVKVCIYIIIVEVACRRFLDLQG